MSLHDALMMSCFFFAGIHVHAPGTLSEDPCSEHGCSGHTHLPFVESKMATPDAYCDVYIWFFFQAIQYDILQNVVSTIFLIFRQYNMKY